MSFSGEVDLNHILPSMTKDRVKRGTRLPEKRKFKTFLISSSFSKGDDSADLIEVSQEDAIDTTPKKPKYLQNSLPRVLPPLSFSPSPSPPEKKFGSLSAEKPRPAVKPRPPVANLFNGEESKTSSREETEKNEMQVENANTNNLNTNANTINDANANNKETQEKREITKESKVGGETNTTINSLNTNTNNTNTINVINDTNANNKETQEKREITKESKVVGETNQGENKEKQNPSWIQEWVQWFFSLIGI